MEQRTPGLEQRLFTVGHSNHSLEAFIGLLKRHGVAALVDVRSQPYSRHAPHFGRRQLEAASETYGIGYVFLGEELGGRPVGDEFYDAAGYVLYDRLARSPGFLDGIRRLEEELRRRRAAIVCSEEDPAGCHRRLLVGRVLAARGVAMYHIRGDGRIQMEGDLRAAEMDARRAAGQLPLFDTVEEPEWKSTRSVSRRRPPPSSLKH